MATRRKIISASLAVLGLLLLCGIAAVKLLLSDERLADFARDRVKASLGRELTLGKLSLQFHPLPTVILENAALGNASWAKEASLLHTDRATARLDLTSLLRGELEVASLAIEGLKANLEVSADNRKNWQMQGSPVGRNDGNGLILPLHLASLQIKDAQIHYAKHGEAIRDWWLDELNAKADKGWRNLRLDAKLVQNDIPLSAKARFTDLSGFGREAAVSDGEMEFSLGSGKLAVSGSFPISGSFQAHKLKLDFGMQSADELLRFFGFSKIDLAPVKVSAELQGIGSGTQVNNLLFQVGHLKAEGKGEILRAGEMLRYRANLASDYLDWTQMMRDLGRPNLPPKPPNQLFRDTPLGWRFVSALQKVDGEIDLHIRRVKQRSGIEWKDLKAEIDADEKQLAIDKFTFGMLDGAVKGALFLKGDRHTAKLDLDMSKVGLGKWLAARGHKFPLAGGPMDLNASLSAKGLSMKDLAESMTGPVRISVGQAKLHSKQIQQAETWLIGLAPVFSETATDHVNLACISAYLPFKNGRAQAEPIGGIRSDASQMLASGYIDFREQALDLRGRVRARSGVSLGVSNIAGGNLKIAGRIGKPEIGLDPESTPGVLARIGAAIMTSGVSILATALWDAANPASDPCQITFSANKKRKQPASDSISRLDAEPIEDLN